MRITLSQRDMKRYKSLGLLVLFPLSIVGAAIIITFAFLVGFSIGMIVSFLCAICIVGLFLEIKESINQPLTIKK